MLPKTRIICVLAFSTVDRDSFEALPTWKKKVEDECGEIAMVLVQNKVDLLDKALVGNDEAEGMAERLGLKFYRTCVKDNLNVEKVFEYLVVLADQFSRSKVANDSASPSTASQHALAPSGPAPEQKQTAFKYSSNAKSEDDEIAQGEVFTIGGKPSKQRSGGKKKMRGKLKNCAI